MKLPVIQSVANSNGMQACAPHRAKLSKASCAARWARAQEDDARAREQFRFCADCAHGERNARGAA